MAIEKNRSSAAMNFLDMRIAKANPGEFVSLLLLRQALIKQDLASLYFKDVEKTQTELENKQKELKKSEEGKVGDIKVGDRALRELNLVDPKLANMTLGEASDLEIKTVAERLAAKLGSAVQDKETAQKELTELLPGSVTTKESLDKENLAKQKLTTANKELADVQASLADLKKPAPLKAERDELIVKLDRLKKELITGQDMIAGWKEEFGKLEKIGEMFSERRKEFIKSIAFAVISSLLLCAGITIYGYLTYLGLVIIGISLGLICSIIPKPKIASQNGFEYGIIVCFATVIIVSFVAMREVPLMTYMLLILPSLAVVGLRFFIPKNS